MKRIFAWFFAACVSLAQAQTQTTGNVVYSTVNPAPAGASYSWSGFQVTESAGGGLSGGHVPGYNTPTGQFLFGYAQGTIGYSIALNTVLSGTGIQIGGIEYGLQYFNQDYSRGYLDVGLTVQNKQGTILQSYYHSLPQTTEGWTNFDQTKTFANPHLLSNIGNANMMVIGRDDRFWAGYWGPQFRNPYMRFTYTADICAANPLSSPDCPGYAAAYFTQQCTISALYNPSCPGYAVAYFTQQCTASALYDPACPGYAQAYFTQQCTANALYSTDCPGYAQAYFNQQCQISGLYSNQCPNYAEAYAKKNVLGIGSTTTPTAAATAVVTESATSTAKTDPVSIATTSTTTSTTSPTSVTSVTSVVSGGSTNATTAVVTSTSTQSTTTTTTSSAPAEAKKTDAEVRSATTSSSASSGGSAKSRAETVARQVAREASEAKTFEAQAATQSLQLGLMGFVPGFDAYGAARIIDVNGQQMARLYNRPTVDNRNALRRLTGASDRVHRDMVDQQYQLGK